MKITGNGKTELDLDEQSLRLTVTAGTEAAAERGKSGIPGREIRRAL